MKKSLIKVIGIPLFVLAMSVTSFASPVQSEPARVNEQVIENQEEQKDVVEENVVEEAEEVKEDIVESAEKVQVEEKIEPAVEMIEEIVEEIVEPEDSLAAEVLTMAVNQMSSGNNDYPIVLVHGFAGWGRQELNGGFKYWGGDYDLQQELMEDGYIVYTAAVGPVSSNWDRACELYAQLTGTRVDYGQAHADKYGHERYGRNYGKRGEGSSEYEKIYENIFESQGSYEAYEVGDMNKIHIVGHSMGGQTVRTIDELLKEGSAEERAYGQDNLSPLFVGGNDWIASVTTVAAPHDGTTASDANPLLDYATTVFSAAGSATGSSILEKDIYDFKLDQWGLKKESTESQRSYVKRVLNSNVWEGTEDIATYDLTTWGAKELNEWVKANSDVYYFSWSVQATNPTRITGHHIPDRDSMNKLFYPHTMMMGRYARPAGYDPEVKKDLEEIDKSWWPNDGYVNTISSNGPKLGSNDVIKEFDPNDIEKGVWNAVPVIKGMDHEDIIGRDLNKQILKVGYSKFFDLLHSLQ